MKMCRRIFKDQTNEIGPIPFYKIGTFGKAPDAFISKRLFEEYRSKYSYPKRGQILISAAGTVGRTVEYKGEPSYFQDSNIVWLDTDESLVDNKFLMYVFDSFPWKGMEGTTINRLYNDLILSTEILLPPLHEQRVIAGVLSGFDEHLANLDELIAKKKAISDGALEELVTGRTRIADYREPWVKISFEEAIQPKARIGWQGLKAEEYLPTGYSYLIGGTDFDSGTIAFDSISFVSRARYELDPYIHVRPGDVLVTKDGTIGKVARVPQLNKPATLNSGVFVFRPNAGLSREFLYWVLMSPVFERFIDTLAAGSTIKHLYQKDLKDFTFMAPPSLSEQTALAEILFGASEEIRLLEEERAKVERLKLGAMDDLLTGRVRLPIEERAA
ncbi:MULTISPECIES: restriction endonuclease subunit S [Corynebacterium]|uniref:restriction endonuclease subunit S n=1 Tax=Corynebacterium TaxID=1716 RepID=UPI001FC8F746|nr:MULTISPECIES: restriction endonuclease subunit S [Corynebacterium]